MSDVLSGYTWGTIGKQPSVDSYCSFLPSDLTGADIWSDTFPVEAGFAVEVADWERARVVEVAQVDVVVIAPARETDHVGLGCLSK